MSAKATVIIKSDFNSRDLCCRFRVRRSRFVSILYLEYHALGWMHLTLLKISELCVFDVCLNHHSRVSAVSEWMFHELWVVASMRRDLDSYIQVPRILSIVFSIPCSDTRQELQPFCSHSCRVEARTVKVEQYSVLVDLRDPELHLIFFRRC